MGRCRFLLAIGVLLLLLTPLACTAPDVAADKEKVLNILADVHHHYQQDTFVKMMDREKISMKAAKKALAVQERIANHYGMTYNQYLDALHLLKEDSEVKPILDQVKKQMSSFYKFRFKIKNPTFTD